MVESPGEMVDRACELFIGFIMYSFYGVVVLLLSTDSFIIFQML